MRVCYWNPFFVRNSPSTPLSLRKKMVTPWGLKFAVHLITNTFGKIVAKVCEKLLHHGPLNFPMLIRYTELSKEQVKNSILVLIQHNCVQSFVPQGHDELEGLNVRTHYVALFDNILHRLRFPKFIEIVSQKLGDECADLLEGLLRDGRLTLKQMIDRASQGKENAMATNVVRESFHRLLTARYVEHCPAHEPVVTTPVEEEPTRKRGAKSAKTFKPLETIEQRVIEAAVPGEVIRFSLTAENVGNDERTLWRANFEEFIRSLRHKVLVENVRTRMDDRAATVLSAILEATRTLERKVKTENSVPLSLDTIFTEVVTTENGRTLTRDRVQTCLVQLGCSPRTLDDCSIDLKGIIQWARNEEVESIVSKRYGKDAHRIFRHLSRENQFCPTDKIADSTLVEKREAPRLLYRLWKDNYLHMEKLTVTGTKQSILMWKVNEALIWEHVLDEMYHAALNLSTRTAFEQQKDEELLNVSKAKIMESEPLQKKHKRLVNVMLRLGSSLMKLDDAVMLFHDF